MPLNTGNYRTQWLPIEQAAGVLGFRRLKPWKYGGQCVVHGGDNKNGATLIEARDGGLRYTCHTAMCDWKEIRPTLASLGIIRTVSESGGAARQAYISQSELEQAQWIALLFANDVQKGRPLSAHDTAQADKAIATINKHPRSDTPLSRVVNESIKTLQIRTNTRLAVQQIVSTLRVLTGKEPSQSINKDATLAAVHRLFIEDGAF